MSELVRMGQAPRQQQTAPQPRWLHGANAHFPSHSQPRAWPSSGSTKAGVGTELLESEQQQQQGPVWFESDVCPFPPPLTFHCPEGDNGDTYFEGTVGCEDPRTEVCHHEMTLCFPSVTVHRLPKVASPPRSPIFPLSGVRLTFFHLKLHPKHE